jgi:endonuclease YncB( thermonuclease family)
MRAPNLQKLCCLVVSTLLVVGPAMARPPSEAHDGMTAKCVKVVDGDTLIVECDRHRMTVDLEGVDAPELGQPWGREVRSFVRKMVRGEAVEIVVTARGEHTATARVKVDGQDLSRLLAERGLAWATDHGELEALSLKARDIPCGLWMDPEPLPPWQFRDARA